MMSGKLPLLILVIFISKASCLTEVWLDERNVDYIQHELLGTTISIGKTWWDTYSTCHVIFPNGSAYELYPLNTLNIANIYVLDSEKPFDVCGIGFRNVGVEASGTYQIMAQVIHSADNSRTLYRQNFNLVVTEPSW